MVKRDLKDLDFVQGLQKNIQASLETPQGQEVMRFLEDLVGYDSAIYDPESKENTWVRDGARQVVTTLKTLMKHKADDIVSLAKSKEA